MRLSAIIGAGAILLAASCSGEGRSESGAVQPPENTVKAALAEPPAPVLVDMPEVNPRRGRILFVTNGCVICHQVNGVGGAAAPRLDARGDQDAVDPLAFAASMWRGAEAMTALQSVELGYVIELDGQDIADLAAFAGSPDEQALLTLDTVSKEMRDWFLDEPYWLDDEWGDFLRRGSRIPLDDGEPQ